MVTSSNDFACEGKKGKYVLANTMAQSLKNTNTTVQRVKKWNTYSYKYPGGGEIKCYSFEI